MGSAASEGRQGSGRVLIATLLLFAATGACGDVVDELGSSGQNLRPTVGFGRDFGLSSIVLPWLSPERSCSADDVPWSADGGLCSAGWVLDGFSIYGDNYCSTSPDFVLTRPLTWRSPQGVSFEGDGAYLFVQNGEANRFYRELLDEYLLRSEPLPGSDSHRCFYFRATCLSCEQKATWEGQLACLLRSLDNVALLPEGERTLEGRVGADWVPSAASSGSAWTVDHARDVIRGKIAKIYERHGHELAAADKARAQREAELAPVSTKCSPDFVCSGSLGSMQCRPDGYGGTFEEDKVALECRRLLKGHVRPELVSDELGRCMKALADVARRKPFGDQREEPVSVAAHLFRKQASLLTLEDSGRGALRRQIVLLGALQEMFALSHPRGNDVERAAALQATERAMEQHLGVMWKRLRELAGLVPPAPNAELDGESLLGFIDTHKTHGRALDHRLLRALFMAPETLRALRIAEQLPAQGIGAEDGSSAEYPVLGAATPRLAAEALRSLVQHLEARAPYHDLACTLGNRCSAPTRTGRRETAETMLWRLLTLPEAGAQVPSALLGKMGGWGELLTEILPRIAVTRARFDEERGAGANTAAVLDATLASLVDIQRKARAHVDSYEAFGLLDPTTGNALDFSFDPLDRDELIRDAGEAVVRLESSVEDFKASAHMYLSRASELLASSSSREALNAELQNRLIRLQALADRVTALKKRSASEGEIVRASDERFYSEAQDQGALVQQGDSLDFTSDGESRHRAGDPVPEAIAVARVSAPGGAVLLIETSGQWSPTCALRRADHLPVRRGREIDPDDVADFRRSSPISNLSDATAGPEGFTIVQSEAGYRAVSHQEAQRQSLDVTWGQSFSFGVPGFNMGGGHEYRYSTSETDSDEEGLSARTEASFATGLFLPGTPYRAPAGSLLLVRPALGRDAPAQVQIVRTGLMRVQVPVTSTYYFVVNDSECVRPPSTRSLDVHVKTLVPQDVLVREAVAGLSLAVEGLKAHFPTFVQQGGLLPSDGPALRAEMWRRIQDHLAAERLTPSFLPALESYLSGAIERSINVLEVRVESLVAEREIKILQNELVALETQLAQAQATGRLLQLGVRWMLENLDEQKLQSESRRFLERVGEDLLPLIAMWYPEALTGIAGNAHISGVLDASIDARLVSVIEHTADLVSDLFAEVGTTAIRDFRPQKSLVSLRIPLSEEARLEDSLLPTVDALRSRSVSEAIRERGPVLLPVYPDDVYSASGGLGRLFCHESLPVVERVALHFVVPGVSARELLTWNTNDRRLLHAEGMQTFVLGAEGAVQFELKNERQRHFAASVSYSGMAAEAGGMVAQRFALQDGSIVGLSPFSSLVFDFQDLAGDPQAAARNTRFDRATELILFLEIDSKWVSQAEAAQWVRACAP